MARMGDTRGTEAKTSRESDTMNPAVRTKSSDGFKFKLFGKTNEFETAEEPDTTSQIGKQMSCHKGRQMNWRQPESRTPPARLGDK